jgi:hypothetical protein
MTQAEVANGLVLLYTAEVVAGKGGAAAILPIIFMVRCRIICVSGH